MVDLSLAVPESLPGDSQRLRNQLKIDDQIVIGFVGSFYAYEGLDQLLVAARQLQKSRADFVVLLVGGGPEEARLKQLCLDLQVNSCVRFVSRVHHSEVFRFYHIIDILAFPRKRMRLTELVTPLKPLEAMAHSRPVLASDVGGHCELIEHGVTGFLYPADDVQALAKCLNRLLDHPEERAAVAEKGRKYVAAERTWDQLTNIYATVYDRIMAPSRRSDAKIF
jgi:glycosyltransferase involved in cell wall biosynthesis